MRILHFADLHIGVENYGKLDVNTGLSTRLSDFLSSFDALVDFAIDNRVDVVLFCGDAYKSRDPSQTHQREFACRIARLSAEGIPVFLLVGNHDIPHVFGRATALDIFETLGVSKVVIGDSLATYCIKTRSGPLQILSVPWVTRSSFLAREESKGLTPDQVNEAIQERLVRIIRAEAEKLDPDLPAVLAGHLSVGDAKAGSEQWMTLGRDYVLLKSDVAVPRIDYVALGHIHRHQILGENPHIVYSGSLERVDFGEEKDEKGFCLVDLDSQKTTGNRLVNFEFRKVDARRFITIKANIQPGDLDPTGSVVDTLAEYDVKDAIVRLLITVPIEMESQLQDTVIRTALGDAHYVASMSRQVIDQPRSRLGTVVPGIMDHKTVLRMYMDSKDISPDRANVLMEHAEELMKDDYP